MEGNKYLRGVDGRTHIDIYDICDIFNISNPGLQQAIKKILCAGQRGYKDALQDLDEAIVAINRAKELITLADRRAKGDIFTIPAQPYTLPKQQEYKNLVSTHIVDQDLVDIKLPVQFAPVHFNIWANFVNEVYNYLCGAAYGENPHLSKVISEQIRKIQPEVVLKSRLFKGIKEVVPEVGWVTVNQEVRISTDFIGKVATSLSHKFPVKLPEFLAEWNDLFNK